MFDPVTANLLRSVRGFEGLDSDRLPELLTAAFTEIVTARIQLGQVPIDHQSINEAIDRFSRLGNTLEPWVLLEPQRKDAAAVAYVAAQSHLVVEMGLAISRERIRGHLTIESISPTVSAMLLFLVANQPADAASVAAHIKIGDEGTKGALLRDLINLAIGNLEGAANGVTADIPENDEPLEQAADVLFEKIRAGVRIMARRLLALPVPEADDPASIFGEVMEVALHRLKTDRGSPFTDDRDILFSSFTGPFQLASLLRAVWGTLATAAVVNLPPPAGIDDRWHATIRPILSRRPYLWPNHISAVQGGLLDPGKSAVLTFPTGAGKSTLSELKIAATLCSGKHIVYLAPTHALVAQVKSNLRQVFGRVGVADALPSDEYYAETDEDQVEHAIVTVMTPERCLASLGANADPFGNVGLIVFDECHLIHPRSDGQNRRSLDAMLTILSLFTAAPGADWLMISAMLANGDEIAQWIEKETGRPCASFKLDWKPTRQARGCVVFKGTDVDGLEKILSREQLAAKRKDNGELPVPPAKVQRQLLATAYAFVCLQQTWQTKLMQDYRLVRLLRESISLTGALAPGKRAWRLAPNKNEVAAHIAVDCAKLGMKVLLFAQQRDHTASIAGTITELGAGVLSAPKLDDEAKDMLRVAIEEIGSLDDLYVDPSLFATCHHALMLPVERDFAERVFRAREGVGALAATPTLAQGINLPADIVLIVGEERRDKAKNRNVPIDAHEILNAAGRAGRAGHVAQGMVLVVPNNIVRYRFGDEGNSLGGSWRSLQAVFAQADQCLVAKDPVQQILDVIQIGFHEGNVDALYFLRRLPIDSADDSGRAAGMLRRSFGAFHAKTAHEKALFEAKVTAAVAARRTLTGQTVDWRSEIASRVGVSTAFVEAIDATLATSELPLTTLPLVEWFFAWLKAHAALVPDALGYRLARYLEETGGQLSLFGSLDLEATRAWINGESVRAIADILSEGGGGKRAKEGREFVLWAIPELSFGMGIVAQVQRRRIELELTEGMSVALATSGLCLREGCPSPEVAALRLIHSGECKSRQELIALWKKIAHYAGVADSFEKFGHTRRRVSLALDAFNMIG